MVPRVHVILVALLIITSVGSVATTASATEHVKLDGMQTVSATSTGSDYVDVAASDLQGNGTASDPYVITNASELQAMENDLTAYYVLGADINASSTAQWNGGTGFDPVGGSDPGFRGVFDGQGHTITNLTIARPDSGDLGIFGMVGSNATIQHVRVRNISINGRNGVAGLAADNTGVIRNVSVTGTATGLLYVGGVAAENGEDGVIRNAWASVDVEGSENVGGLVGGNFGTIEQTYATGQVRGSSYVGPLAGRNFGTISDSYIDRVETGQSPIYDGATSLLTPEMTGSAARTNMTGLAFDDIWQIQPGDYPSLDLNKSTGSSGGTEDGGGDGGGAFTGIVSQYNTTPDTSISISELGTAAADYAQGDLTITELGAVAAAYAQS